MSPGMSRARWLVGAWIFVRGLAALGAQGESLVPATEQISEVEARLTYARILSYRRETWADAIANYSRVLREQPTNSAALTELADLRVRLGDLAAAEQGLRAALAARPGEPAAIAALVQLLLWTGRPAEGERLLETASAMRKLTEPEQLLYAQVLTRVGRHAEANRRFDEQLARPGKPAATLLSAAADGRLAAGDAAGARELYRRAVEDDPALTGARRGYALTLTWTGADAAARPQLEQALAATPDDPDLVHAYVRAMVRLEGISAAIALVRGRVDAAPRDPRWRAEWAELEAERGHAVRSRQLFSEALALGESPAMRLRAGLAAIAGGDFFTAEAALRAALRSGSTEPEVRVELGRLLVSVDRTEEAEQFYERWLLEAPNAEPPLVGLVRLRLKERDFSAALVRCDALLTLRPRLPEAMRLKAETLLALHRDREAAAIYSELATLPDQRAEAELGLGRATSGFAGETAAAGHYAAALRLEPERPAARFHAAGRATARTENFLRALTGGVEAQYRSGAPATAASVPTTAPRLLEWAGLYAEHGDFSLAVRCLKAARMADAEYFPAAVQLAEFLAIDKQFDAALIEFAQLREAMPGNRQVLIGEARALAWSRRYEAALAAYENLAVLNPADPVPQREAARAAGWGKMRDRAAALYRRIWTAEPVDRILAAQLKPVLEGAAGDELVMRWRQWTENPVDAAETFAASERFAGERFALQAALPEPRRKRIDEAYLAILPALRLQRAWWLENAAKQFTWDRRYVTSQATYRRLLEVEPGNEEALFELSQVQAARGFGPGERATLTRLLEVDANHSFATQALRRRDIRSGPMATVEARWWRESGRGELASLRRNSVTGEVQDTWNDQFSFRLGSVLGREDPTTRDGRYAYRGISFGVDGVIENGLSGSAAMLHREFYDPRIGHADSGQAQLWWRRDAFGLGGGYEKREELANEFGLFQGTRSDQTWLGGNFVFNRRFDADARLTRSHYSDGNRGTALVVSPSYAWTDHPRIFKSILTLEFRDTDNATVYVQNAGRLTNLIHPYWTPQNYLHAAVTLEWYRDLARDLFVGSEAHFYDLRLTFGTDSESNATTTFEADWQREWSDRWIAHGDLYLNLSREWDALGLRLRLARRF